MSYEWIYISGQIGLGMVFGTLSIIGLLGNILVCTAIYTNRKLRKKENLYFVSLAGADLLLAVLVMPFAGVTDASGHWQFGGYCKAWITLDILCCTASNLNLCAISFDRYYHIRDPMRYKESMSIKKIAMAICMVWTLSAAVALAPLHFDDSHYYENVDLRDQNTSAYYRCRFDFEPIYAVVSSLISFYIPCAVMTVAYAKLYKYAQRHARSIWHQLQTMTTFLVNVASQKVLVEAKESSSSTPGKKNGNGMSTQSIRRQFGGSDRKARVTLGAIMGVFIGSWLPFFVCHLVKSFCGGADCVPNWIYALFSWMGYANSAQNPIIYTVFNKNFRQAFRKILRLNKPKRDDYFASESTLAVARVIQNHSVNEVVIRRASDVSNLCKV